MHGACRAAKATIPKAPAKGRWATQTGREASTGNIWLLKVLGSAKFFVPHRDATRPESRSPRDTRPHRVHSGRHTYATRNEARNRRLRHSFRTFHPSVGRARRVLCDTKKQSPERTRWT